MSFLKIDDLHPVVGFRVLRRGSFRQHDEISLHLVVLQPSPNIGLPVLRVIRLVNRVDPVGELELLAGASWELTAAIQTGSLNRAMLLAVYPLRVGTNTPPARCAPGSSPH